MPNRLMTLEYYDLKKKEWKKEYLEDCYVLAIVPDSPNPKRMDLCGLNVCIVLMKSFNESDKGPEEAKEAIDQHFKEIRGTFTVYLLGPNGVKIPLDIHAGNGWSKPPYDYYDYERQTCCYFGYVHPEMFGSTELGRAYTIPGGAKGLLADEGE